MVACPDDDGGGGGGGTSQGRAVLAVEMLVSEDSSKFEMVVGFNRDTKGLKFCYLGERCKTEMSVKFGDLRRGLVDIVLASEHEDEVPVGLKFHAKITPISNAEGTSSAAKVTFKVVEGKDLTGGMYPDIQVDNVLHTTEEYNSDMLEDGIVEFTWGDVD